MLRTVAKGEILEKAIEGGKALFKHEDIGYIGAFLAQLRQTLIPYLKQQTILLPGT